MNDYVFHIEKAKLKKNNPYFIVLEGSCTQSQNKFKIEFCGTEANNIGRAVVPEEMVHKLKEALCEDVGYPPYTEETAAKIARQSRYGFDYDKRIRRQKESGDALI